MDSANPPRGRVAEAAARCLESFEAISIRHSGHGEVPGNLGPQLADCLSRYRIWGSNIGAWHSKSDKRSADYRLRDAPEVEDRIAELLEELSETNQDICSITTGEQENRPVEEHEDESSDPDSDNDGGPDELSELWLSVGDIISSLMKVSMLVRKATGRDRYLKAASAAGAPFLPDFDKRHVEDKFPKARQLPWLVDRLGAAITQRRQYLRYSRDHRHRIGGVCLTISIRQAC